MNPRIILYSKSGLLTAIAVSVAAAAFTILVAVLDGPLEALRFLPLPLTIVTFSAWMWAWPRVTISTDGVTVRNQFRTVFVAWPALRQAEVRYGLYLHYRSAAGDNAAVPVSAVPSRLARSRSAASEKDSPVHDGTSGGDVRVSLDPASSARLINDEIRYYKNPSQRPRTWRFSSASTSPSPTDITSVKVSWNWVPTVMCFSLVALSTLAIVLR